MTSFLRRKTKLEWLKSFHVTDVMLINTFLVRLQWSVFPPAKKTLKNSYCHLNIRSKNQHFPLSLKLLVLEKQTNNKNSISQQGLHFVEAFFLFTRWSGLNKATNFKPVWTACSLRKLRGVSWGQLSCRLSWNCSSALAVDTLSSELSSILANVWLTAGVEDDKLVWCWSGLKVSPSGSTFLGDKAKGDLVPTLDGLWPTVIAAAFSTMSCKMPSELSKLRRAACEVALIVSRSSSTQRGFEGPYSGSLSIASFNVRCFRSTWCRMSCTEPNASKTDNDRFWSDSVGSPLEVSCDFPPGGGVGCLLLAITGGWVCAIALSCKCATARSLSTQTCRSLTLEARNL